MCRITGIWDLHRSCDLVATCERMRDTLIRGGPDDAGIYLDREANLALGHRRLSIIDLTPTGHQPMTTLDRRFTICYNGEVYNYQEIREELEAIGMSFRGTSDTEVLLNAFAFWGPACVERFIGMFAFAIWDARERALLLYRDRIGVKPLYYYQHNGLFAFASELKALHITLSSLLEIDPLSLGEFFHYGYITSPRSIYKHTFKLEPGHWLKVSASHTSEKHQYWSYMHAFSGTPNPITEEDAADTLEEIMVDAFRKRLIADVPVGVFLSGGIDSSLVTAILAKHTNAPIKTFTIGFQEESYDESPWARRIAQYLGTEHTEKVVTPEHAKRILPLWPEIFDEPFGDISGIPTTIIAQMTQQHVKVSLSADGGDELFCGYHRYWVMKRLETIMQNLPRCIPKVAYNVINMLGIDTVADMVHLVPRFRLPALKDRLRKFQAVLSHWQNNAAGAYLFAVGYWLPHEIRQLTGAYADPRPPVNAMGEDLLNSMMLWDLVHYLPEDILTKVDRTTMFASLEGRDPFLDHRIVEFALRLPIGLKYKQGKMKYLLKKLLSRYLPKELYDRPKQGFAVPIYSWLHDDLREMVETYLNPDEIKRQNYIDHKTMEKTVREFKAKNGSIAVDRVWLLLVFMMWRQRYSL